MTAINVRRGLLAMFAGSALAVTATTIAVPPANAQPAPCTSAGLSTTVSGVTAAAGQYLTAHQDADQALTAAGLETPQDAQVALQAYFLTHPQELTDLRAIAGPLTEMRQRCNQTVSPAQIAGLLQAFAG
jgi:heme-binding protein